MAQVKNFVLDESTGNWRPQAYTQSTVGGGGSTAVSLFKSVQTELRPITVVGSTAVDKSTVLDTTNFKSVAVFVDHAPIHTSTPTAGTEYRIDVSQKITGDDAWRTLISWRTGTVAAGTGRTDLTNVPGATSVSMASTPGYTNADSIFFFNHVSLVNSEWLRVRNVVANQVIIFQDPFTSTQISVAMYNCCEHFVADLDVEAFVRLRAVCNNSLHTNAYTLAWRCAAIASYEH